MLRAFALSGNYVAGAWRGQQLLGAAAGIHGRDGEGLHLHSVITGVRPDHQARHVGLALKQHQRAWALALGIDRIVWTFDPLVRRNARFNLTKLGAEVVGYHENLYGPMDDAFNRGDESDRCLVMWRLTGPRADAAARGAPEPEEPPGATRILSAAPDGTPRGAPGDGATLLAWVPEDIMAVRARDPAAARAWRVAVRDTLGRAVGRGYTATAMLRSGSYVLEREP
jgi:predicted GNAT superfamily acetyltransferase